MEIRKLFLIGEDQEEHLDFGTMHLDDRDEERWIPIYTTKELAELVIEQNPAYEGCTAVPTDLGTLRKLLDSRPSVAGFLVNATALSPSFITIPRDNFFRKLAKFPDDFFSGGGFINL